MPDAFFNTATTDFDKSIVPKIEKKLIDTLRAGLGYMPRGSVLPSFYEKGTNGVFRAFRFGDLDDDGGGSIEDGQADPDVESLDNEYITFTGTRFGRLVGWTDNTEARSPFDLHSVNAEKVARAVAVVFDNVAKDLYDGGADSADIFAGTSNTNDVGIAAGDIFTPDNLKDAVALLRNANVPPLAGGDYALVASPLVIRDLQGADDYVSEMKHADPDTFLTGVVDRYAGAQLIPTTRAIVHATAGTSSIDVYYSTLIGADALYLGDVGTAEYTYVGTASAADRLNRLRSIGFKLWKGGVINDTQDIQRFLNIASSASLG